MAKIQNTDNSQVLAIMWENPHTALGHWLGGGGGGGMENGTASSENSLAVS